MKSNTIGQFTDISGTQFKPLPIYESDVATVDILPPVTGRFILKYAVSVTVKHYESTSWSNIEGTFSVIDQYANNGHIMQIAYLDDDSNAYDYPMAFRSRELSGGTWTEWTACLLRNNSYNKYLVGLGNLDNVKQYSISNPPPGTWKLLWAGQTQLNCTPTTAVSFSFALNNAYTHYLVNVVDRVSSAYPYVGQLLFANPRLYNANGTCNSATTMFGFANSSYTSDNQIIAAMSKSNIKFKTKSAQTIYVRIVYGLLA